MQFSQDLKRMGVSFAIMVAMVALCSTYSAQSHHRHGMRANRIHSTMPRRGGPPFRPNPGHGDSMLWVKVAVDRAISIASYMGA